MSKGVAIVTGVSRLKGIGRAICLELAEMGFDIFFTYWTAYDHTMPWDVDESEPNLIQEEIRKLGVRCEKLELNLSVEGSVLKLLEETNSQLGSPKVLVNNATYSTQTSVETLNMEELNKHIDLNIKATTMLAIEFIRQFDHSNGGRIINITSGQSLGKMPNEIAYAISKGAIETLTKTISSEIAGRGITINAVNPGPNDTGWMDDNLKSDLKARFPMGRIGVPKDTANLIGFLVSEKGEWITGQIIHSEGGFMR